MTATLNVLTISDRESDYLYHADAGIRFPDIDLILSCGDLSYQYIEFVQDALRAPLYYVRGNHAPTVEYGETTDRRGPLGGCDLHRKCVNFHGLLMAGFEGSLRYRNGPFQYSQAEMWGIVIEMLPALLLNRVRHGRYLDVLVSHAPSWGVNDGQDKAHQGFKALRWLLKAVRPRYHFHGHTHILGSSQSVVTSYEGTQVINTYGYRRGTIEYPRVKSKRPLGNE